MEKPFYLGTRELPHFAVRKNGDDLDRVNAFLGVMLFEVDLHVVEGLLDGVDLSVAIHVDVLKWVCFKSVSLNDQIAEAVTVLIKEKVWIL